MTNENFGNNSLETDNNGKSSLAWEWLLAPQLVSSAGAASTAYILREIRVCCCNKVIWGSALVISNLRERWRHLVTAPGGPEKNSE